MKCGKVKDRRNRKVVEVKAHEKTSNRIKQIKEASKSKRIKV